MNGPVHIIGGRTRTRQTTITIQSAVAAAASSAVATCTSGSNPGASRTTDADIFGGTPVFHAKK